MGDFAGLVKPGVVEADGSAFRVNLDGAYPDVTWPGTSYLPQAGDNVMVLMAAPRAYVLGPALPGAQRPMSGTIAGAASGGVVPVNTTAGTVQARYTGTAPSTGTLVFLDWQSTTPRIMAGAAATVPTPDPTPPPTPPPPPPPVVSRGTLTINAIDSATWRTHGWLTGDVYQWRYGSEAERRGAWFYGGQATQLAGATITGLRMRLGARIRLGDYNSTLTAHLYRHGHGTRPPGDVSRGEGPHNVDLPKNYGGGWIDLPLEFAPGLLTGGGMALLGAPYLAIAGINSDPASGQLAFDWTR